MEASGLRIHHPNRERPESKATKAVVVMLLIASAALIAIVLIGGFEKLAGAQSVAVAYILIYLAMAYFVARWRRGVLPMAAALAIIFTTFAAVAAPAWFARDEPGLEDPLLPAGLLGLLTVVVLAVQIVLILFAMRGFQQEWNVEVELREGDRYDRESGETIRAEDREDRSTEPEPYEAPPESARSRGAQPPH